MESTTTTYADLRSCLIDFQQRFNTNTRVKKLIKKWNRSVMLEALDSAVAYSFIVENQELTSIVPGLVERDPPIHLQADEEILIRIFSGDYNPSHALIDGVLAVYSDERDKVKLEAMAMVLWGL